jgi:hypothetical protein
MRKKLETLLVADHMISRLPNLTMPIIRYSQFQPSAYCILAASRLESSSDNSKLVEAFKDASGTVNRTILIDQLQLKVMLGAPVISIGLCTRHTTDM